MNRLVTIAVFVFWAATMGWLVWHDVWPAWTAQDAPKFVSGDWLTEETLTAQARIENKHGHRLGTVWTVHSRNKAGLNRRDVAWLDKFPMIPALRLEGESDFTPEGDLDTFVLKIFGHSERIELRGERYSGHLAFMLEVGAAKAQRFKMDAAMGGIVADAFRPFPNLPAIEVGQSWRMQVVNPLAMISGMGSKMIPMLVRVTGKERLLTENGPVECFVVEAGMAKAWVDSDGVALQQEMNLPVGGTIRIIAEKFDESAYEEALAASLPPYDK